MPAAIISSEFQVAFPEFHFKSFFANICCFLGVAVALAIKAALEKHDISGKIVLLGTPGRSQGFLLVYLRSTNVFTAS